MAVVRVVAIFALVAALLVSLALAVDRSKVPFLINPRILSHLIII